MPSASARIAALYYYPVKSARGIAVDVAPITAAGFADDRRWMLITPAGRFITQRDWPRLALLRPALSSTTLQLAAPSLANFSIALSQQGSGRKVHVWKDEVHAFDEGDAVSEWLRQLLGTQCRLVRFDPAQRRLSSREWTGVYEAENRFSDGYPLLVLSAESLQDLNGRLSAPLPIDRFRPNILLEGVQPYDEDRIDELSADGVRLKLVKPCTRCKIPTTNQETGVSEGEEPLRTLKGYRYDARLQGVCFGQNTIVIDGAGKTLRCGQQLEIRWKAACSEGASGTASADTTAAFASD
jgi:uncharacterized protein YcbX